MKKKTKVAVEIGAGVLTAAAVASAAAYFLSDNKTVKKGKAQAKVWIEQAKREVVKNAKQASKLGAKEYAYLVDQAVQRYGSLKNATGPEIIAATRELKGEWDRIQKQAKSLENHAKRAASKGKRAIKATPKSKARSKPRKRSSR